jgi:hypothetical protein
MLLLDACANTYSSEFGPDDPVSSLVCVITKVSFSVCDVLLDAYWSEFDMSKEASVLFAIIYTIMYNMNTREGVPREWENWRHLGRDSYR